MIAVPERDLDEITSAITKGREARARGDRDAGRQARHLAGRGTAAIRRLLPHAGQKSFKLIARKNGYFGEDAAYSGKGSFAYPLFAGRTVLARENAGNVLDRYDSFILRNGGNDSLLHTAADPRRRLSSGTGLPITLPLPMPPPCPRRFRSLPSFTSTGEYYGILDMRENLNENYVKRVWVWTARMSSFSRASWTPSRHCDAHANGGACRFCNMRFYYETDDTPTSQAGNGGMDFAV